MDHNRMVQPSRKEGRAEKDIVGKQKRLQMFHPLTHIKTEQCYKKTIRMTEQMNLYGGCEEVCFVMHDACLLYRYMHSHLFYVLC